MSTYDTVDKEITPPEFLLFIVKSFFLLIG